MLLQAQQVRRGAVHGKALIVEDSPSDGAVLRALLEQLGCECEMAKDGAQAVDAALKGSFDFIFMDVLMPGMDGREATRFIHSALGPRSPFIVAVTGLRSPAEKQSCMDAGMDYFLAKPVG